MSSDSRVYQKAVKRLSGTPVGNQLELVARELIETIGEAQTALKEAESQKIGFSALSRCGKLLHESHGVLKVTETYGAALLVEEMEATCSYLGTVKVAKRQSQAAMDALHRAMVQLPIYIESLLSGSLDVALILLPLINDLRVARDESLLSEKTLLLVKCSEYRKEDWMSLRASNDEDPVLVAIKLRPQFQRALLGWIREVDNEKNLEKLSSVVEALQNSSKRDDMFQLWWVVGGIIESLQNGGLETSLALKRLLGRTDRQLKFLIDEGIEAFDTHPITDMLNNLLYFIVRSSKAGTRVRDIREAFGLIEFLVGEDQVQQAREAISAPSIKLMKTVATAIDEDLNRAKEALDNFVDAGINKGSELLPPLDLLKKISQTLSVLGLGELRGDIDSEIERLMNIVAEDRSIEQTTIVDIASTLLKVEQGLDQQLIRMSVQEEPEGVSIETEVLRPDEEAEYRQVTEAVMRESMINLARIKETFSQNLSSADRSQGIDALPGLIGGIHSGLLMLGDTRTMRIVDNVGKLIIVALNGAGPSRLTTEETNSLADAIVSIEYYMETIAAGLGEPDYMLDNAETRLNSLDTLLERLDLAQVGDQPKQTVSDVSHTRPADEDLKEVKVESADVHAYVLDGTNVRDTQDLDSNHSEVFIAEAKDLIVSINHNLPAWVDTPDDLSKLVTVRRSFHTLKGSGRMVGAEVIGEFAWSIENLMNRLINKTLVRTPPVIGFIVEATKALPELVAQFDVGMTPEINIAELMVQAKGFAEGDPNAPLLSIKRPESSNIEEGAVPFEMDPVLRDIFSKETKGHLKVIYDYLDACKTSKPPYQVTDKCYRACHTLQGSATLANIDRGVMVASAMNRFVRRVYDQKIGLSESDADLLLVAANALETVVADINRIDHDRKDFSKLVKQLDNLTNMVKLEKPLDESSQEDDLSKVPEPRPIILKEVEEGNYDVEIAAIFSHESAELLESVDNAFEAWKSTNGSHEHMQALKRQLHTLKGGARMAGIKVMSNLSHEIEALLINIDGGRIRPSMEVIQVLQQSIDELHRMRDMVIAGKVVAKVALQQRIHAINLREGEPELARASGKEKVGDAGLRGLDAARVEVQETDTSFSDLFDELSEKTTTASSPVHKNHEYTVEESVDQVQEFARIDAKILENLLNATGEMIQRNSILSNFILLRWNRQ